MSERTISPDMDHTHQLPEKPNLEIGFASPTAGLPGPVKRKWSPDHSDSSTATLISQHEILRGLGTASPGGSDSPRMSKRAKINEDICANIQSAAAEPSLPSDRSRLPVEMWQSIFACLPPDSLGRLMSVNKVFYSLVAPKGTLPAPQIHTRGRLSLIQQENLWSLSRRAFFPGTPRPLFSRSEYEAWKLIRGRGCEFCGKRNAGTVPPLLTSPWAAGPGNDYVRVIWPFAVRSCGNCLRARLQKVCL
jgi:F-box domain